MTKNSLYAGKNMLDMNTDQLSKGVVVHAH